MSHNQALMAINDEPLMTNRQIGFSHCRRANYRI